ncbi:unnamed protein product [Chironomus riparius]|uniref:Coiled-coil-helix-coiled-coil-helix domain-containing protein 7 n=1 Tax=Chironomus riparius TaxID=315576 RepID=A0A9N9RJD6_9DIPT|nr:unnamed protein product [Chironomus riparius]
MPPKGKQDPRAPDNPCFNEQNISYKCLSENNYDKQKCEIYFANYTECMKFWTKVKFDRRRLGIIPEVPPIEERESIKNDYMKTKLKS